MRILVTGSSGHLGEALRRVLPDSLGLDILPSPYTDIVGSVADRAVERRAVEGVDAIVNAATLHTRTALVQLRDDAPGVVRRHFPAFDDIYAARGWRMFGGIERVYVNERARTDLGWRPTYDFGFALERLAAGEEWRSELALSVGAKGYHAESTGPYTVR